MCCNARSDVVGNERCRDESGGCRAAMAIGQEGGMSGSNLRAVNQRTARRGRADLPRWGL